MSYLSNVFRPMSNVEKRKVVFMSNTGIYCNLHYVIQSGKQEKKPSCHLLVTIGYGQSSYNSQSYGGMQHGNQGYGSSRYGGIGLYKTTTSYKQPTYQVIAYRPSYTSYKQQPSYQTSYGQQPQGHSSYGRKYSGYYTQRRYHTQPAMKY